MATKKATKKEKLPPLSKFDYKKELRKNGFKISRDGTIKKQVVNKPRKKGEKPYTEQALIRRQAMTGIPAYRQKKYTKTQALNEVARKNGYKDFKAYNKVRKSGKHRVFQELARKHGKDFGVGGELETKYKAYVDSGYDPSEEYDLLYTLGEVGDEDEDRYKED